MRTPASPPPLPPTRRSIGLRKAGRGAIVALLLMLLLVVQLPLVWMLVTAFKVRGTAFQLQFIPQTSLYTPGMGDPALPLPVAGGEDILLHFEHRDRQAGSVDLLLIDPAGERFRHEFRYAEDGLWILTVKADVPGVYLYAIELDGEEADPEAVSAGQLLEFGLVEGLEAESGSTVSNVDRPDLLVYIRNATLTVHVRGDEGRDHELLLAGTRLTLTESQSGRYELQREITVPSDAAATGFRLVERRSFATALADMYTTDNFRAILTSEEFNFFRYFINSLVVATSAGILTVLICTMGGYAFSQLTFHFRDQLFVLVLASMLVPGMIFMVPQFSITINLGLMNTYPGMVVPHLANIFGLFLLRQYIGQIPRDLFAAAEIDGASQPQIFQTIVVPICLPIMLTLFLLTFVTQWSNFLWQLIINTGDSRVLTLPVGLQQFRGQNTDEWEMIMAGASFSIVPIAILFLCFQGYFLRGLAAGAVKE